MFLGSWLLNIVIYYLHTYDLWRLLISTALLLPVILRQQLFQSALKKQVVF